jgi:hypothetical protein
MRQQQAAITELHQEVLQLRALAGTLQDSTPPAGNTAANDAAPAAAANGGSPASTSGLILNLQHQQQYQQQLQQLAYGGSYKAMTLEDFRSLPDKIILVRHAESQGNVDARIYSTTPDYEVRSLTFDQADGQQQRAHTLVVVQSGTCACKQQSQCRVALCSCNMHASSMANATVA